MTKKALPPHKTYILRCADDCWYVGTTRYLSRRIKSHFCGGKPTKWTALHPALELVAVFDGGYDIESLATLDMVKLYGFTNVRGAGYADPAYLNGPDISTHDCVLVKKGF